MRSLLLVVLAALAAASQGSGDDWLSWTPARAEQIGKAAYMRGRVGGFAFFDTRLLKTERSVNYKLAATWVTPDVSRATARLLQLADRLSDDETRALVREADVAGDTIVLVEIDPREGSGVIPNDWAAFLQPLLPDGTDGRPVRGLDTPKLRDARALRGVLRRNYDYDRFWVVFPLRHDDGVAVLPPGAREAELVVRIYNKEGRVKWPIPQSVRDRVPTR